MNTQEIMAEMLQNSELIAVLKKMIDSSKNSKELYENLSLAVINSPHYNKGDFQ